MTPRQAFVAAFCGGATDTIPVYEQAFASDVASKILGREAFTGGAILRYQEALWGSRGEAAWQEFHERMRRDIVELHETLGFGAIRQPWLYGKPTKRIDEYRFLYGDPDGHWIIYKYDPRAHTFAPEQYSHPPVWRGVEEIRAEVEAAERRAETWSQGAGPEQLAEHTRLWLSLAGDRFEVLAAAGLSVPLNEKWLTACAACPDLVAAYLQAQAEVACQMLDVQARLGLRIIWGGGDLADNSGPVYGPKFFRQAVLPAYKRIVDHAHHLGMKYLFRSDGYLWSITDNLFIDAGMDGYGEIDWEAGMRIPELAERYPNVTYWGNVGCGLLRNGTPEQVRQAAEEIAAVGRKTGRVILGSSNAVLPGTPPENYFALLDATHSA